MAAAAFVAWRAAPPCGGAFFVGFDDVLEGRQVLRETGQHFLVGGPTHGIAQLERRDAEFQVAGPIPTSMSLGAK